MTAAKLHLLQFHNVVYLVLNQGPGTSSRKEGKVSQAPRGEMLWLSLALFPPGTQAQRRPHLGFCQAASTQPHEARAALDPGATPS